MSNLQAQPSADKSALRLQLKGAVAGLNPAEKARQSEKLGQNLMGHSIWASSRTILGFIPLADEPDIMNVLAQALVQGKTLYLPAFEEKSGVYRARQVKNLTSDLVPGRYGIREPGRFCAPVTLKQLDLALVPGVGFDVNGCRLGRGNGYYDRLLAEAAGLRCGLAFECQMTNDIPKEHHDIVMNWVVLPSRWLRVNQASRGL